MLVFWTAFSCLCVLCSSGPLLLWTPAYGQSKAGRPARTFIQLLCDDTGCNPEDLPKAINDWETWRESVRDIRASRTSWWWWCVYPSNSKRCTCKKPWGKNIIRRPFQGIWLDTQSKDEANTSRLRPTQINCHWPDGDTDYFDTVAAPYMLIICLVEVPMV